MNIFWLVRMSRWARNPPSMKQVLLVIAVVAVCVTLFLVERYIGWPDALTADRAVWRRP